MNQQIEWIEQVITSPDQNMVAAARAHQLQLTKPAGALGQLENIAISFAGMQGTVHPEVNQIQIAVFAGDHGVTEEKVSAYPQAVTAQMLENFAQGGAAINVLANELSARLSVVDVGVNAPASTSNKIINKRIIDGTANFCKHVAMSFDALERSLEVGRDIARQGLDDGMQLFIGGEMGIGNTTSATALAASLLEMSVRQLTGAGSGLNEKEIAHKCLVIDQALYFHRDEAVTPLDKLRCFAGVEIVALVGAYIFCAQNRVPVLVDGFIASVAAIYAQALNSGVRDWLLFSHKSKEPGHAHVLQSLQATPLIDLQMRLGEGSGAAVVVSIIKLALALHNNMATFSHAGVSGKEAT